MLATQLTGRSIKELGEVITGDGGKSPYRSGRDLVTFFNEHGANDLSGSGFPARGLFAEDKLREFNGTPSMARIITAAVDPRHFVGDEDHPVEETVEHLNAFLKYDRLQLVKTGLGYRLAGSTGTSVELSADAQSTDPLSHEFIIAQIQKCDEKLTSGDFDGSITNARALLEAVLRDLETRITGEKPGTDGDLLKQYKRVQKLLNLSPGQKDIETPLKQVLTGFASVVSGIAGLRNAMSDAHARRYRPQEHHARLVVNSAKTLADFLFETYEYQKAKGALSTADLPREKD